jgi:hypothetical protein
LHAENYETITKMVSLLEDFNLDVHLQPLPQPAPAPEEDADKKKASPRIRARSGRTAAPANSAKAANPPNCNPPYTLSPDGIRTYKAECF